MTIWVVVAAPLWLAFGVCAIVGVYGTVFFWRDEDKEYLKMFSGGMLFLILASGFAYAAAKLQGFA